MMRQTENVSGFSAIGFGLTVRQVRERLGPPNRISEEEREGYRVEVYDDLRIRCYYDRAQGQRLAIVRDDSSELRIGGRSIVGLGRRELCAWLAQQGVHFVSDEDRYEEWLDCSDEGVIFILRHGVVEGTEWQVRPAGTVRQFRLPEPTPVPVLPVCIGEGIGAVRFSLTEQEIREQLGAPDRVYEDAEADEREEYYASRKLTLYWDRSSRRMNRMECESDGCCLQGARVVGIGADRLEAFLREQGAVWTEEDYETFRVIAWEACGLDWRIEFSAVKSVTLLNLSEE